MSEPLLLHSDAVDFPAVRSWAEQACRECYPAVAADAVGAVVLALHEATRNVVEHAYRRASGPIEVRAAGRGRTLLLCVIHDGAPFDRARVPAPSFDGTREDGFGLFLIEAAVDRVEYGCTPEGRGLVRLEKRLL